MAAASERVFEFLEEAEEVQTAEHPLELANVEGNVDFLACFFWLPAGAVRYPRFQCQGKVRTEDRHCRPHRCRKNHNGETADAVL